MVIRKTADLRSKKAELWGVSSGEQEASELTSMSPLTFTGTRKDDDGSMVRKAPKMEVAFRPGFERQIEAEGRYWGQPNFYMERTMNTAINAKGYWNN